MAFVLSVALVQTKKTMAFASKEKDGVDDLDVVENRCSPAQPGQLVLSDSINTGHEIDDTKWGLLQCQDSELSVGWRRSLNQAAAFRLSNLGPSSWAYPNVTVFRSKRAECVEFFNFAFPVEIACSKMQSDWLVFQGGICDKTSLWNCIRRWLKRLAPRPPRFR